MSLILAGAFVRISLRLIEIFVRVVETGSFVAAARSLLVDPAVVSRAIKSLEDALGILLFTRSTRVLKLTTEGRNFYRDAVAMLKSFEATLDKFQVANPLHGELKVGLGPALSRRMLMRAVASFQEAYPQIRLVLVSMNDPAEIGGEAIDVLIRPRSTRQQGSEHRLPQGMVVRKLMQSPIAIYASPSYLKRAGTPRNPTDLADHKCLALLTLEHDVQDEWLFAKSGTREKVKFAPQMIAQGEELREAALADCGVVRLLTCHVQDETRSGALVRLLPDWECLGGLPIVAIYRKSKPILPRINALVRHLTSVFQSYEAG